MSDLVSDSVTIVITATGGIVIYLTHNKVRVAFFKTTGAAQNWIRRRKCGITETIWE